MDEVQVEEASGPRLVGIVDDEFTDARLKERDGDRASRAACTYEECPRPLNVGAVVLLCLDEGEPVEHVAMPGAVGVAPDDAHDPEHPGSLGASSVCH
jgi:hypothetical protein